MAMFYFDDDDYEEMKRADEEAEFKQPLKRPWRDPRDPAFEEPPEPEEEEEQ